MKTSRTISPWFLTLVLLACCTLAKADPITLTMNNTGSGQLGQTISFQGILNNLGAPAVFLNSISFTAAAGLTVNTAAFFQLPSSLAAGQITGLVNIFAVTIGPLPIGTYLGSITILGGVNANSQNSLLTRDFQVVVVPEPGTLLLLGTGLALLRRRRKAK